MPEKTNLIRGAGAAAAQDQSQVCVCHQGKDNSADATITSGKPSK